MKKIFLIISLITFTICGKEIKKMINFLSENILLIKQKLEKAPNEIKLKYYSLIQNEHNSQLQIIYNPAILEESFKDFIKDIIPYYIQSADNKTKNDIIDLISELEFIPNNKIFIHKFLFKKGNSGNKSLFFAVMCEKNNDTYDFLFIHMAINLNFGKDYFIFTKSNNILFWGSKEDKIIKKPEFLPMNELEFLFNLLQIPISIRAKAIFDYIYK